MGHLFQLGFRPFFLLAAFAALFYPAYWVSFYVNGRPYLGQLLSPTSWHAHEMIYGFAQALLAGFLLTASANWTGKKPYQGKILVFLVCVWLVEHVSLMMPLPRLLGALLCLPFQACFTLLLLKTLSGNPRNLYRIGVWAVAYCLAKFTWIYAAYTGQTELEAGAQNFSLALIRLILLLIAGRILPFFSSKRFADVKIHTPKPVTMAAVLPLVLLCLPAAWLPLYSVQVLAAIALAGGLCRLYFWKAHKTVREPMLAILHVGHVWVLFHLFIEAFSEILQLNIFFAAVHALGVGGLGSFGIGMMVRVALGHTARPIHATKMIIAMFICVSLGAVIRVFVPILSPEFMISSLHWASGFWTLSFVLYLIVIGPILFAPKAESE